MILLDGIRIWMNVESFLCYLIFFIGEKREVFLEGEVFFEVVKDVKYFFIVYINRYLVEVFGISFNIFVYFDYKVYMIFVEGCIKVSIIKVLVVLNFD